MIIARNSFQIWLAAILHFLYSFFKCSWNWRVDLFLNTWPTPINNDKIQQKGLWVWLRLSWILIFIQVFPPKVSVCLLPDTALHFHPVGKDQPNYTEYYSLKFWIKFPNGIITVIILTTWRTKLATTFHVTVLH